VVGFCGGLMEKEKIEFNSVFCTLLMGLQGWCMVSCNVVVKILKRVEVLWRVLFGCLIGGELMV